MPVTLAPLPGSLPTHRPRAAITVPALALAVVTAVSLGCSKSPSPAAEQGSEPATTTAPTPSADAAKATPEVKAPRTPKKATRETRFDDCSVFRTTERYTQWSCRPRGLFVFNAENAGDALGSRPLADTVARALEAAYLKDAWEVIKKSPPARAKPPTEGQAHAIAYLELRSLQLGTRVAAVGAAREDGTLLVCVLPATMPQSVEFCESSVTALLDGERLPRPSTPTP